MIISLNAVMSSETPVLRTQAALRPVTHFPIASGSNHYAKPLSQPQEMIDENPNPP